MNPLFQGVQANDAKDLVNFIIMTLHEELNMGQKLNVGNINSDNQINQNFMFNYFMNTFFKENKSIISDIFYGVNHTMIQCSNCKSTKNNYDAYFSLNFPLEEVRKYKIQELTNTNNNIMNQMNMNQNMFINMNNQMDIYNNNLNKIQLLNQNNIDIYDCFDYNQKIYYDFMGQNQLYCDRCRQTARFVYIKCLYNCPEVLILVLDRELDFQSKIKFKFDFQLNLLNYIEDKASGCLYELICVINKLGESGMSSHFIANCKSPKDGVWYQYNDEFVTPVTNFNQQIFDLGMAYILFYKKMKMNNY